MNKFSHVTSLVVFGILILGVGIIILSIRSCRTGPEIKAMLSDTKILVDKNFAYSDSTYNAHTWHWEFGDGSFSDQPAGLYAYRRIGRYKIRLTVNGKYEKLFTVNVKPDHSTPISKVIEIQAPQTAMQGEYVVFKGIGNDKQWRWEFGESGIVDSRKKNPLYAYRESGTYQIRLRTENTQYPVIHTIEITPCYSVNDSTDMMSVIGSDIREKLQAITEGKSFNSNYNYIIRKYMCNDEKTEVVINNNKFNDIYSYCQGLAAMGRGRKLTIEHVSVEIPEPESGCVTRILVIQTEKEKMK